MIDVQSIEDHLRQCLPGVPRAGPNAIDIPAPFGVAGLVALGESLTLRTGYGRHRRDCDVPARTREGGAD